MCSENFQKNFFSEISESVKYPIARPPLVFGKETPPTKIQIRIILWEHYYNLIPITMTRSQQQAMSQAISDMHSEGVDTSVFTSSN